MYGRQTLCNWCKIVSSRYSSKACSVKFFNFKTPYYSSLRRFSTPGNSGSAVKKYWKQIAAGVSVVSGALAYRYFTGVDEEEKVKKIDESDQEEDIKVDYEEIAGNLALIEEYGPIPYLLVGAGTASFAASRAIRGKDPTSKILILGEEAFYPYMRPPLSKEMWFDEDSALSEKLLFKQWNGKERSIFFEKEDFYCSVKELLENKNGGVSVMRGLKVVQIDPTEQVIYLDNGKSLKYEKCLLATGGQPKNLPVFENADEDIKKHVTVFRNIRDFKKLNKISKKVKSIAIVGGGFLGSEMACALAKSSKDSGSSVVQLFPESGNMGKILPEYLCKWTTQRVRDQGVDVKPGVAIKQVSKEGKVIKLHLDNGESVTTEHVVITVGLQPRTELADVSGLEIDEKRGGFLVNTELEARKNLWIAGDASCFYDTKLGRRRVEHHDHAVVSGRLAGENMTGRGKPYWHQSMFWSDLGPEIGYEAIGIIDSSLETVGVFSKASEEDTPKAAVEATGEGIRSESEPSEKSREIQFESAHPRPPLAGDDFGKGIVFYLRNDTIVGILLWNVFMKMPVARKIISEAKPHDDLTEVAKLFDLKASD